MKSMAVRFREIHLAVWWKWQKTREYLIMKRIVAARNPARKHHRLGWADFFSFDWEHGRKKIRCSPMGQDCVSRRAWQLRSSYTLEFVQPIFEKKISIDHTFLMSTQKISDAVFPSLPRREIHVRFSFTHIPYLPGTEDWSKTSSFTRKHSSIMLMIASKHRFTSFRQ